MREDPRRWLRIDQSLARKAVEKRIPDRATALRCIDSIARYLKDNESPLAAEDLHRSVDVLMSFAIRNK